MTNAVTDALSSTKVMWMCAEIPALGEPPFVTLYTLLNAHSPCVVNIDCQFVKF